MLPGKCDVVSDGNGQFGSPSLAAVDLGSNSFHMVIARVVDGRLHVVDRLRDPIRLAAGLDAAGAIDEQTQQRAVECLRLFGERIRDLPARCVRIVGTNTLRKARNAPAFIAAATRAVGHAVEVIRGREEARLIYLGVTSTLAQQAERRLVVDIGGGSTECVVGEGSTPLVTDSLFMGCVSFSQSFFSSGKITKKRLRAARLAAQLELQSIVTRYRQLGWSRCVGASGTIKSVAQILSVNGWSETGIDRQGLQRLIDVMLAAGHVDDLRIEGLDGERRDVIAGGVAILAAIFDSFSIDKMQVSSGALREGLLYDLLGRISDADVREQAIDKLMDRFAVDRTQAERVEAVALRLLADVRDVWQLDASYAHQMLSWSARLHEIGLMISYGGYHKHGAYLIANADLPGFSREDQQFLAAIIRTHRRKIPRSVFRALPEASQSLARALCVLLRLAVVFSRSRTSADPLPFTVKATPERLELSFPERWLETHPLSLADLQQEATRLAELDVSLSFGPLAPSLSASSDSSDSSEQE